MKMLAITSYDPTYVEACRKKVNLLLATYRKLVKAAPAPTIDQFEPGLFDHMVLALDNYFCHRLRGREGKDGNPLNEVRMIANSIMNASGIFTTDKAIKYTRRSPCSSIRPATN
jgi:hypothetical protein